MIKTIKLTGLYLLTFLLVACGGGGGGGTPVTPTDPNTVFSLFPSGFFNAGYSDVVNYTGTDTLGGTHIATFSTQTQAQTTFLGEPAIPVIGQLQLTNTANNAVISNIGTVYWSTSATDRHRLGYSDSTTTTVSATTTAIPQTAMINDFGVTGTYIDNAGEVGTDSWRLDDGGSGRAEMVNLSTTRDQFGDLISSSTTTTLIDTSGNSVSTTLVLFIASENATITLSSN